MRTALSALAAGLLLVAACGNDDDVSTPATTSTTETTVDATTSTHPEPATIECTNDDAGYTLARPADWHTNDGTVVAPCSAFDPDEVELEPATEPNTAIFVSVDDVDFDTVSDPASFDRIDSYEHATVDGRRAVVVRHTTDSDGLEPAGTEVHVWAVDVDDGTLIARASSPDPVIDEWAEVLDAMMASLRFDEPVDGGADQSPDEQTLATLGTFAGAQLAVSTTGSGYCLEARDGRTVGADSCWTLDDLGPDTIVFDRITVDGEVVAVAGFASADVARVIAGFDRDAAEGVRPTAVPGTDARAWAVPDRDLALHHVVAYDDDHRIVGVLDADGEPTEVLADVNTEPEDVDRGGETVFLTDVAPGRHAGFDRISFEFEDGLPGYDVSYQARPIYEDPSGREVQIEGDAVLIVRMSPAAAHETTGDADRTYTGPQRLAVPGLFAIDEVVQLSDFEGVVSWAIGVRSEQPFRAIEVGNILVVDVKHAEA